MNKITMKKSVFIMILSVIMLLSTALGAVASNGVERIQATLNHNIKFLLNGKNWTPKDSTGKSLAALVYNGSTYVPLRAVSDALGSEVKWNPSNSTITINSNDGIPYLDGDTSGSSSSSGSNSSSSSNSGSNSGKNSSSATTGTTAKGTLTDPVPLGKSFSYSDVYSSSSFGVETQADYTITVKNVASVSNSEIEKYNLEKDSDVEYKMLTVKIEMKNGKVIKTKELDGEYISWSFEPRFWGTRTIDNDSIIGTTSPYTLDGSLTNAFNDAIKGKKVKKGETASYTVEGKVIIGVYKDNTNYFAIKKNDTSIDYDDSFIYFKLK